MADFAQFTAPGFTMMQRGRGLQAGRFALATVGGDPNSATVDRVHDIPGEKSSDSQHHRSNQRGGHAQDQTNPPAQLCTKSRRHPGLDLRNPGFDFACFPAKRPAPVSDRGSQCHSARVKPGDQMFFNRTDLRIQAFFDRVDFDFQTFFNRIEGNRPHLFLRKESSFLRIIPFPALRQSLRMARAAFIAFLCFMVPTHALAQSQSRNGTASYSPPPTQGTPEARLEHFERGLLAHQGRAMVLSEGTTETHAVFYAPLGVLWMLEGGANATRVRRTGAMRIDDGTSGTPFAVTEWENGAHITLAWPTALPEITAVSTARHPLAAFHDRLLTHPLAWSVADLPVGSRFVAHAGRSGGGTLRLPGTGSATPTLWRSLGDRIVIIRGDGYTDTLPWRALDAALTANKGDAG